MFIIFTGFIQGVCTRVRDLGNISEFCLPKLPKGKELLQGEDLGPKGTKHRDGGANTRGARETT